MKVTSSVLPDSPSWRPRPARGPFCAAWLCSTWLCAAWLCGALLCAALLAACGHTDDNPYDPAAARTVAGERRIVLVLPPELEPDRAYGVDGLAALIDGLEVRGKRVDGDEPAAGGPCEGQPEVARFCVAEPLRLGRTRDGRTAFVGTYAAPYGIYDVSITHTPDGLLEPVTRPAVAFDLAGRGDALEIELARSTIGLDAQIVFEPGSVPADAWFELRGIGGPGADCVRAGRTLRRYGLLGSAELQHVVDDEVPRPIEPYACALVGAPGYETRVAPVTGPALGPLRGTPDRRVDRLSFGRVVVGAARVEVALFGLPEARQLALGARPASTRRLGSRLALMHLQARAGEAGLTFAADAPPARRIRRVAVLDASDAGSVPRGRFTALDALPRSQGLPYLGVLPPAACKARDPDADALFDVLQLQTVDGAPNPLRAAVLREGDAERLLPVCLSGPGVVRVLFETEDGAVHADEVAVEIDRIPVESIRVQVRESRPALGAVPATSRTVPQSRGRYPVHAASHVTLHVQATAATADARESVQVLARVLPGEWRDNAWALEACPAPNEIALRTVADDERVEGPIGRLLRVQPGLMGPTPSDDPAEGPLRLQRNRICLFVEDEVGNRRAAEIDVDLVAGEVRAQLVPVNRLAEEPAAGAPPLEGADAWQVRGCEWDSATLDACFESATNALPVSDRIGLSARVEPESVDETVLGLDRADEQGYGLGALYLRIEADVGGAVVEHWFDGFEQGMSISHRFAEPGTFDLSVIGVDLLGREVPFRYNEHPTVVFLHDPDPPEPDQVGFLVCEGCEVRNCNRPEGVVENPCERCVSDSFVVQSDVPTLLARAGEGVPLTLHFARPPGLGPLCGVTREHTRSEDGEASEAGEAVDETVHHDLLCGVSVDVGLAADLDPADDSLPEEGTLVRFVHDVVDRACNQAAVPGALAVRFDTRPPRVATAEGAGGEPMGVEIHCRALKHADCVEAGPSCWETVSSGRAACDLAVGERVLENVRATVLDAASALLPAGAIRHRLVLSADDLPPPDALPSVCGESLWRGDPIRPRRATCDDLDPWRCGCAAHGDRVALRSDGGSNMPVVVYTPDGRFIPVEIASFDDLAVPPLPEAEPPPDPPPAPEPALRAIRGVRLFLHLEDAVGHQAIVPLVDPRCAREQLADCLARTYTVPIRPPLDEVGDTAPPWSRIDECVPGPNNGTFVHDDNPRVPDEPLDALCVQD